MSKSRNGLRKCGECGHFFAAHSYKMQGREPCVSPGCTCTQYRETVSVKKPVKPNLPAKVSS